MKYRLIFEYILIPLHYESRLSPDMHFTKNGFWLNAIELNFVLGSTRFLVWECFPPVCKLLVPRAATNSLSTIPVSETNVIK